MYGVLAGSMRQAIVTSTLMSLPSAVLKRSESSPARAPLSARGSSADQAAGQEETSAAIRWALTGDAGQRAIVAQAIEKGEGDFVEEVAAELPLQAIAELLGVPTIAVVGRGLADGVVELRDRVTGEQENVAVGDFVARVRALAGRS